VFFIVSKAGYGIGRAQWRKNGSMSGAIVEMSVKLPMLVARALVAAGRGLLMRGAKIGLGGTFGMDGAR